MEKALAIMNWCNRIINMKNFQRSTMDEKKACFGGLATYAKLLYFSSHRDILDAYQQDFCSPDDEAIVKNCSKSRGYQEFVLDFGRYMSEMNSEQLTLLALHGEKLWKLMHEDTDKSCLTLAYGLPEKVIHLLMSFSIRVQEEENNETETVFDEPVFLPPSMHFLYQKGTTCAKNCKRRRN